MKIGPKVKAWLVDVGERAGSTFAETFLGVFGVQGLIALSGGNWHAAATLARSGEVAALGAALAVVKGAIAAGKSGTVSPASVASAPPKPTSHRKV